MQLVLTTQWRSHVIRCHLSNWFIIYFLSPFATCHQRSCFFVSTKKNGSNTSISKRHANHFNRYMPFNRFNWMIETILMISWKQARVKIDEVSIGFLCWLSTIILLLFLLCWWLRNAWIEQTLPSDLTVILKHAFSDD